MTHLFHLDSVHLVFNNVFGMDARGWQESSASGEEFVDSWSLASSRGD